MVLSAPGLMCFVYSSVGNHPPPQEAAGDPVICLKFMSDYDIPLRYTFRQVAHTSSVRAAVVKNDI